MTRFMSRMKLSLLLPLVCVAVPLSAGAAVRLPAIFSDHLVLQREAKTPVWGWADPGEDVTVSLAGRKQTAKAGADGKWTVWFENLKAGGPHRTVREGRQSGRCQRRADR